MGAACSENVDVTKSTGNNHQQIEQDIRRDKRNERVTVKLLLLGAGECGKSTVLKQMQILHSNGFTDQELDARRYMVFSNTVTSMAVIIKALSQLDLKLQDAKMQQAATHVLSVVDAKEDTLPFTRNLTVAMKRLWDSKNVRLAYERRNEFQLADSAKYFFDSLDRIAESDYRPTQQDILHTRVPTTGVVEVRFEIKGFTFRTFDVGGQRSERRKWIHLFDDVSAIIFISAINEYDQVLMEDSKANRLTESMQLFAQILNSRWFVKAAMILFLNKTDLFREKVQHCSIRSLFPTYHGQDNYDDAVSYIRQKFEETNENPETKKIYVHETCATDTNQAIILCKMLFHCSEKFAEKLFQVVFVIESVLDMVIQKSMVKSGMA